MKYRIDSHESGSQIFIIDNKEKESVQTHGHQRPEGFMALKQIAACTYLSDFFFAFLPDVIFWDTWRNDFVIFQDSMQRFPHFSNMV